MKETRPGWKLLGTLVIGVFMGAIDLTVLAPALPRIGDSFGMTPAAVVLAFSIYAAFYAASVPLMSKLADVRGYKPVYGISMLLFAGGSALAALAPSLPVLVGARVVQGIGGGGLFPIAQAIVGAVLPLRSQGRVLGLLLGVFALGAALGPNLGGFFVQTLSWQWIFWINVPLGVAGVLLLWPLDLPDYRRKGRIDWLGALLVAITFGSLVLGIEGLRGIDGGQRVQAFSLLAAAVIGLGALVFVERRRADPILDFRLVTSRAVVPVLVVSFLVGYALLGGLVFAPFYVQLFFQANALGAGAILNAAAVGLGVSSWVAGTYTHRLGPRRLVQGGMALTALGLALIVALRWWLLGILGGLVFVGAGVGLAQGPLSLLALSLADKRNQGQISGLIAVTRSLGGAMGITLAGVMLGRAAEALGAQGPALAELGEQAWGSASSLDALRAASPAARELVRHTLSAGILQGWYWALGATLVGLGAALLLREAPPRPAPQAPAATVAVPEREAS